MKKRLAFVGLLGTSGIQCLGNSGGGSSFAATHVSIDAHADLVSQLQETARMASRVNKNLGKRKARLLHKAEFHAAKAHEYLKKITAI